MIFLFVALEFPAVVSIYMSDESLVYRREAFLHNKECSIRMSLFFAVSVTAILDDSISYELGRHQGLFSSFKLIHTV